LVQNRKVGPALAAGCAIVFKPAESTTLSTLKFAEIFNTVGFPAGTFNLVNGLGHVVGKALSEHMDIDKIAFTGSTNTGRQIAIAAAKSNLKKVSLELGGKSANVVFESANLEEAAKWSAFGIFENAGVSSFLRKLPFPLVVQAS
jgi:aldehyde dehydrogenase (NAD+)